MRIFPIIFLFLLQACFFSSKVTISGKGNIRLKEVAFEDLSNWDKANHKLALQAFLHSCKGFAKMPQDRLIGKQIGNFVVGDFRDVCEIAEVVKTMDQKLTRNFFENWFKPFLVTTKMGNSQGLFTGYYEASLKGSLKKTDKFRYPIYKKPKDLDYDPYFSRAEIEAGALKGKNLEILYIDDIAELFFLHIQGSGRVELRDGSQVRLSFAGRNNQPYTAIANYMIEQGYISANYANANAVKEWLRSNPDKAQEVMNQNASYTFFEIADNEYVVGAQNVPLTPNHSIAVDDEIIPYGLPIWLESYIKNKDSSKDPYYSLLISQDTGTAINGTVRGDVFFGFGNEAQEKASYMASKGQYFILLPVNIVYKLD